MRNVGIKNLYKRGKTFYRLKAGKWLSLCTTVKREAVAQMAELQKRDIARKFLEKEGLNGLGEKLDRLTAKIDLLGTAATAEPLAPSSAKGKGGDFLALSKNYLLQIPCKSGGTNAMWNTCQNALVKVVQKTLVWGETDLTASTPWEKFVTITPSGIWTLYQKDGAGNSSLNQMAAYLRKLVGHLVGLNALAPHFIQNCATIPQCTRRTRTLVIPSPAEMDQLATEWEAQDWELAQMLQFFRFTGARKAAALDKQRGLRWSSVDFVNCDFVLHQKGDKRHKVPMGPQVFAVLERWQRHTGGTGDSLVFPFGSSREDTAQEIMKAAAEKLGGNLRDMRFFHALKHYYKTQHEKSGTPDRTNDLLTFNSPGGGRKGSGDGYRHGEYEVMKIWVAKTVL